MSAPGDGEQVLPTTETDDAQAGASKVTEEQWRGMKSFLEALLSYRDEDDHDPTRIFHKRVNRRNVPDYYDVIKEPMAFSNIKQKTADREYRSFAEFVRDNALIWHNAHTYNRPDAGAYQDASVLKELMETELQKLVEEKVVTQQKAEWPDLGEIPPVEDIPEEEEEEAEGDDEDDEEEEEDLDDSEDERRKKRRGPGRPRKNDTAYSNRADDAAKKKRGRPPKVDTPMEARMKNVLKGLRRPRNDDGLLIINFEKLPEKSAMPEYYATIKQPMAIDHIKKSLKRKRYRSIDDFLRDIDIMFENAKLYNEDDSQIHQDAVELQQEAHRLADIEKRRPDSEFVMEEGRRPRPGGIERNGELWKVGDWVHINNANDPARPIIAQIYRTWEDSSGQEWVNACWYYQPEQTVHQYERHFYPKEVFKTGQYRDHPIDDVIDRCYVMFFTRFPKGRPRGLAADAKVYVCEARYNEEKHRMNKIKTWASCLPDEIRDQDYEMDLFPDGPRRNKKVPSPLLYMLEQGNVTEEVPEPKWGEENAPPIIGGIHKGAREENQTPPPDPTPEPSVQSHQPPHQAAPSHGDWPKTEERRDSQTARPHDIPQQAAGTPQPQQYKPPQAVAATPGQQTPASSYTPQAQANYTPQTQPPNMPSHTNFLEYSTPHRTSFSGHQPASAPQVRYAPMPPVMPGGRQADAFILNDHQNAQISEEVRKQFLTDETGHILFFTKPPLALPADEVTTKLGGHTVAYRAAKLRRQLEQRMKLSDDGGPASKRARLDAEPTTNGVHSPATAPAQATDSASAFAQAAAEPLADWLRVVEAGTATVLAADHGADRAAVAKARAANQAQLAAFQAHAREETDAVNNTAEARRQQAAQTKRALWNGPETYLDDVDARSLRY